MTRPTTRLRQLIAAPEILVAPGAYDRAGAYHEAGADMLFVESPESEDEMRRICETFRGVVPVLSNQIEGGRTPTPGVKTLQDIGFALAVFSLGTAFAAAKGMRDYLQALSTSGDTRDVETR